MMANSDNFIQSVRLTDGQLALLLDSLDRVDNRGRDELRRFERRSFRTDRIMLHVLDGHTVESSFRVVARNLSADGLGFIHGQMIRPGKPVLVEIPRKKNASLSIFARVAHCRHIDGMIHEIGLKFVSFGRPRQGGGRELTHQSRRGRPGKCGQ